MKLMGNIVLFVCATFVDKPFENSPREVFMKNNKNNKKTNVVIFILVFCILIVMIGIGHIDLALSRAQGENVTFDVKPLIGFGYALCAMVVVGLTTSIILGVIYGKKLKKVHSAFMNKDYAFVVSNNSLCEKLKRNKNVDNLYVIMAISYLELGNRDEFLLYLGKIQGEKSVCHKYFWMAVNAVLENSVERFNFWHSRLLEDPNVDSSYLQIVELMQKRLIVGEELTDEDQAIIDKVHYDTIKNLFTEPINLNMSADNLHNNNDNFDNGNDDLFFSANGVETTIYGDVDTTTYGDFDSTQADINNDNSTLYGDDIEE